MGHNSKYAIRKHSGPKSFHGISGMVGLIRSKDCYTCMVSEGFKELVSIWLSKEVRGFHIHAHHYIFCCCCCWYRERGHFPTWFVQERWARSRKGYRSSGTTGLRFSLLIADGLSWMDPCNMNAWFASKSTIWSAIAYTLCDRVVLFKGSNVLYVTIVSGDCRLNQLFTTFPTNSVPRKLAGAYQLWRVGTVIWSRWNLLLVVRFWGLASSLFLLWDWGIISILEIGNFPATRWCYLEPDKLAFRGKHDDRDLFGLPRWPITRMICECRAALFGIPTSWIRFAWKL